MNKGKELCIRVIDQNLMRLIEDWDALDSLYDQDLPDHDLCYVRGCMNTIEKAMITMVNQAESERLISMDDWHRIHNIIMWIGYSAEDRI